MLRCALSARAIGVALRAPIHARLLSGTPKSSRWDQMVSMFKEHGAVFAGYYVTSYAVCFGGAWGAITFAGVDGVGLLRWMGCERLIDVSAWSPRWVNAGIAMVIADFMEPIRLPLVLATTPRLSRLLRRR